MSVHQSRAPDAARPSYSAARHHAAAPVRHAPLIGGAALRGAVLGVRTGVTAVTKVARTAWPHVSRLASRTDEACERYVANPVIRRVALVAVAVLFVAVTVKLASTARSDDHRASAATTAPSEADSLFVDGVRYLRGDGVEANEQQAIEQFRQAAERGHVGAMNNLGAILAKRKELPADEEVALKWLKAAAEQGYAPAMYNYGLARIRSKTLRDPERLRAANEDASAMFRRAVEAGHLPALRLYGSMRLTGGLAGEPRADPDEGVSLLTTAMEKGDIRAQAFLGNHFADPRRGGGKELVDHKKGMAMLRQAAARDDVAAMIFLGLKLVVDSPDEALTLYEKAVERNSRFAAQTVAEWYEEGTVVPKDADRAAAYRRRAADMKGDDPFVAQFDIVVDARAAVSAGGTGRAKAAGAAPTSASATAGQGELRRFVGHTAAVHCVAFSPDGRDVGCVEGFGARFSQIN
jgi:TPR repeat protein